MIQRTTSIHATAEAKLKPATMELRDWDSTMVAREMSVEAIYK
jgi:hypothetical protein